MPVISKGIKNIKNCFNDLKETYKTELSMRLIFATAIFMIGLGLFLNFNYIEWAITIFIIGFMLATELINTSLEVVVDTVTLKHHPKAKAAKNTASASALILSIVAFTCWILIVIPKIMNVVMIYE